MFYYNVFSGGSDVPSTAGPWVVTITFDLYRFVVPIADGFKRPTIILYFYAIM